MDTKVLFIAPLTTFLLAVGGAALAVTPGGGDAATMPNGPSTMQTPPQDGSPSGMHPMMRGGMSGGMVGMMGGCPMMGASGGKNGKVMMQMHGEMMRAMGDIMIKYADKLEPPASTN